MGGEEEKREEDTPRQRRAPSAEQHDNEEASTSNVPSNFTQEQVGRSVLEKMKNGFNRDPFSSVLCLFKRNTFEKHPVVLC